MSTQRNQPFRPRRQARHYAVLATSFALAFIAGCNDEGSDSGTQASAVTATGSTTGALKTENHAPQIGGQLPAQVLVGHYFSYTPAASDPDGDVLAYSATGLPDWAALDPTTGTVRGKPSPGDVGTYSNIAIVVSDGKTTTSLGKQSLVVVDSANGAATLSWMPPSGNEDGTPLTDLAGYRIRYGTDPAGLYQSVDIETPGLASYVVENLTPGTWYFVLTAYTAGGQESKPTDAVSKSI